MQFVAETAPELTDSAQDNIPVRDKKGIHVEGWYPASGGSDRRLWQVLKRDFHTRHPNMIARQIHLLMTFT
jgi:hypothetical protein